MITFHCKHFNDLTLFQLYQIMALRQEVFTVEQNCPYQDADGKDIFSWHLLGLDQNENLVAYTRLIPKGISYPQHPSIGRVVTSPSVRQTGYGKMLLEQSLYWMKLLFGTDDIKIGAQTYLLRFYQSLGFEATGEEYIEDDIPHSAMIYHWK